MRRVIRDRMDYTSYLAGETKIEMDMLDRLAGRFKDVETSEVTVERYLGGNEVPHDVCPKIQFLEDKWELPNNLFKIILGTSQEDLSPSNPADEINIVENSSSGRRNWAIFDVDGYKKRFNLTSQGWKIGPKHWIHVDYFIEDGKLMLNNKVFVIEGGMGDQGGPKYANAEQGLIVDCSDSFSTDKKGNLVRKLICSFPIANIKITAVMSATRVVCSENDNFDNV